MIPGEEVDPPPPSPPPRKITNAQPPSFSSLPDEIAETCLARISKWNYPQVSLVSKRFRSILSSPSLYTARSLIGTTEPCLYFRLKFPDQPSANWFTLWMKPSPDDDDDDDDGDADGDDDDGDDDYTLVHVPSYSFPHYGLVPIVAVGSEIYSIGGPRYRRMHRSAAVRILDCRSHTWRHSPDMLVARQGASVVLIGEKIYVMGGCERDEPGKTWMEVLDIKTQTWRALPSHGSAELSSVCGGWVRMSAVHGKIYAIADEKDYAYDPKEGTWEVVGTHTGVKWSIDSCCVVDNVIYCYTGTTGGCFVWYEPKSREWSEVMGPSLEILCKHPTSGIGKGLLLGMVGHGGKIFVV